MRDLAEMEVESLSNLYPLQEYTDSLYESQRHLRYQVDCCSRSRDCRLSPRDFLVNREMKASWPNLASFPVMMVILCRFSYCLQAVVATCIFV